MHMYAPKLVSHGAAPPVVARLGELDVGGVHGLVAVDEELEQDPRPACRWHSVGIVADELGRQDQLVAVAERDLDVRSLVGVGRKLDAEPAVEREGARQILDQQDDHREARATNHGWKYRPTEGRVQWPEVCEDRVVITTRSGPG